jgi:acyl-[acyl-carrier-protein] desaturase
MGELIALPSLEELPPIDPIADQHILDEIDPIVTPLVNRHVNPKRFRDDELRDQVPTVTDYMGDNSNLWTPALMVPWSAGENFTPSYVWTPEESGLPEAGRSALILADLTEDALPWYSEALVRNFGPSEPLNFFVRVWTGEEDRHSQFLQAYILMSRFLDPVQLERDRMQNMITAQVPDPPSVIESAIYVTWQELATRIAHQNTLTLIADTAPEDERIVKLGEDGTTLANVEPVEVHRLEPEARVAYLRQVIRAGMLRIVGDENKHYAFYQDTVKGAIDIDASTVVKAAERQFRKLDMPGSGIRQFMHHAIIAANAGILDPRSIRDQVALPILKKWDIEHLEGLDGEAEQARERLFAHMANLDVGASLFEEQRDAYRAEHIDDPEAIWVGKQAA